MFCLFWLTEHELLLYCTAAVGTDTQNVNWISAAVKLSRGYLVIFNIHFEVGSYLDHWHSVLQQPATMMCYCNSAANQQNCSYGLLWCVEHVWLLMLWFPTSVISEPGTRCRSQRSLMQALFCLNCVLVITSSCQSSSRKPQLLQWGKIWRRNSRHWWERWKQRQTKSAKFRGIVWRWVFVAYDHAHVELLT